MLVLARNDLAVESWTETCSSDKSDGPTADRQSSEALAFDARLAAHVPDKGHVMRRYCGHYATRTRGRRRRRRPPPDIDGDLAADDPKLPEGGVTIVEPEACSRGTARRRRAELIGLFYEVDPLARPCCGGDPWATAMIQEPVVIDKMLRHLRDRGPDTRACPRATRPPGEGRASRRREGARHGRAETDWRIPPSGIA